MEPALDRTLTAPAAPRAERSGLAGGEQLGHFRVERLLGAGGMGEVYLATDLALDRPVALKVLPQAVAGEATRRDRLVREARAQARVVHANVGHIYYIGEERGLLFVAMEYVPGETLAQRLARGPLGVDEALAAIRGAALGLREAHRAGFLHRDIKPSNLMLDAHGVLKVLDFGLAASSSSERAGAVTAGGTPIEQTSLAGTPLYMAPEQAQGEAIDARADIYALGATLFHLVSGRPPFEAPTPDALRELHASAPRPRVPTTQPRTTAVVGELCARMMAPRAADRLASCDDVIAAIDALTAMRTRPAGLWARAIASGIDFVVLLVPFLILALLAYAAGAQADVGGATYLAGAVVYHAVCEHRWGRTAGKALFELEVVRADSGARPGWRPLLVRNALLYGVLAVCSFAHGWLPLPRAADIGLQIIDVFYSLALFFGLVAAAAFSQGKRAWWDLAAGTVVRYRAATPRR